MLVGLGGSSERAALEPCAMQSCGFVKYNAALKSRESSILWLMDVTGNGYEDMMVKS